MAREPDGLGFLWWSFFAWVAIWVGLFYLLVGTESRWSRWVPPSTKDHENDRYWSARNVLGIIHAVAVAAVTVPAFFFLVHAPDEVRFASTRHLALCALPPGSAFDAVAWGFTFEAVAMAGLAFTAFTAADVVISMLHGLATPDYIAHHIAFITAGFLIRWNCMLPFNAAVLMAMEASTPFLNFVLLFRHRGEAWSAWVRVSGILFVVLFVVFRLVLNTYAAVILWMRREAAMPASLHTWQVWFLLIAVAAGAGVQFFWFPQIARTFGAGLMEMLGNGGGDNSSDSDHSSSGEASSPRGFADYEEGRKLMAEGSTAGATRGSVAELEMARVVR